MISKNQSRAEQEKEKEENQCPKIDWRIIDE